MVARSDVTGLPHDLSTAFILTSFSSGGGSLSFASLDGLTPLVWVDFSLARLEVSPFSVTAPQVPIPAALPLFAAALGAMGLAGWRKKRKGSVA